MTPIVSFYLGQTADRHGRKIADIWAYDHDRLEDVHNYIQFLFPSQQPSQFAVAPLLDAETIQAFQDNADLRNRLLQSLDLMLDFYGLRREEGRIVKAPAFARRAANWLTPYNHNFLRITRILICLKTLGLPEWNRAVFACLQELYADHADAIGAETFQYWKGEAQ
jgi:opioid growth factor receptor-like protein